MGTSTNSSLPGRRTRPAVGWKYSSGRGPRPAGSHGRKSTHGLRQWGGLGGEPHRTGHACTWLTARACVWKRRGPAGARSVPPCAGTCRPGALPDPPCTARGHRPAPPRLPSPANVRRRVNSAPTRGITFQPTVMLNSRSRRPKPCGRGGQAGRAPAGEERRPFRLVPCAGTTQLRHTLLALLQRWRAGAGVKGRGWSVWESGRRLGQAEKFWGTGTVSQASESARYGTTLRVGGGKGRE